MGLERMDRYERQHPSMSSDSWGYVAKVQKLANHDRNIMPAVDVVEMATMGGARALHMKTESARWNRASWRI